MQIKLADCYSLAWKSRIIHTPMTKTTVCHSGSLAHVISTVGRNLARDRLREES